MTKQQIEGIHHVTALARDPQVNVDFYTGVLGLRLVKKTVNFDDPGTYHFYYGDEQGRPGTIITFFPWPMAKRGTHGAGQATATAFSVPEGALGWWAERLEKLGAVYQREATGMAGEIWIEMFDPEGNWFCVQ